MLTYLAQNLCGYSKNTPCGLGHGIAKLALEAYSHCSYGNNGCQIFADDFQLPPIEGLKLYGGPFPSNAVTLPIVQEMYISSPSSQMISKYTCCDTQHVHLSGWGCSAGTRCLLNLLAQYAEQIACRHLVLEGLWCEGGSDGGSDLFGALSAMPRLSALSLQQRQCLHACDGLDCLVSISLHTSLANYTAVLRRVTLRIQGACQLMLQSLSGTTTQIVDLQPNGHVVMCICCPHACM